MNSYEQLEEESRYPRIRFVVIGLPDVGKSALVERYVTGELRESYPSFTQCGRYLEKITQVNGEKMKVNILPIELEERFLTKYQLEIFSAKGFMVVYDQGNLQSYEAAIEIAELLAKKGKQVMLVATKSDQEMFKVVNNEKAKELAESKRWMFCETSAAKNVNIDRAFESLANAVMQQEQQHQKVNDILRYDAAIKKMHALCEKPDRLKAIGKKSSLYKDYLHLVEMIEIFIDKFELKLKKEDCFKYIETVRNYAAALSQEEEQTEQQSKPGKFAAKFTPDERIQRVCRVIASITNEEISAKEFDEMITRALSNAPEAAAPKIPKKR